MVFQKKFPFDCVQQNETGGNFLQVPWHTSHRWFRHEIFSLKVPDVDFDFDVSVDIIQLQTDSSKSNSMLGSKLWVLIIACKWVCFVFDACVLSTDTYILKTLHRSQVWRLILSVICVDDRCGSSPTGQFQVLHFQFFSNQQLPNVCWSDQMTTRQRLETVEDSRNGRVSARYEIMNTINLY